MKQFLCDILSKLASGRYILTLICGIVFAWCAVKKTIPPDAVIAVVSMVFINYFQRTDRNEGQKGGQA